MSWRDNSKKWPRERSHPNMATASAEPKSGKARCALPISLIDSPIYYSTREPFYPVGIAVILEKIHCINLFTPVSPYSIILSPEYGDVGGTRLHRLGKTRYQPTLPRHGVRRRVMEERWLAQHPTVTKKASVQTAIADTPQTVFIIEKPH